ncbi:Alpha-1,3/1,6-mannosyltransferase alg-2 [Erysiphe neolycopersici]|uniref:Alpha-1,3/1,6-mannosyltransferase ALG2 n=1 Tax=Erysiphe neolycopersici TaxID=212602 RepID=A0A420HJP2_9PEZI|nr:Alpha-1,3/1,6-mannosyltransferase alg-2 [Erysiphe neolycopersici]
MILQMKKNIAFFHPDLGIGGAERLIIDAAVGLQNRGHKVVIFTSRCDYHHCFEEARDGTLDVRVRGDSIIPASVFSRFSIVCAILRQIFLVLSTYFSSELSQFKPDAFIVDQLSAGLPWLAFLYPETRILFYCHFPDLLLAQGRRKLWKRIYRIPFDKLEEWSMNFADSVAVNSGFTKEVVCRVFPDLAKNKDFKVIYPCVTVTKDRNMEEKPLINWNNKKIILSINRFERKKDIGLAIKAYSKLDKNERKCARLVLAGGYDNQLYENVAYHKELVSLSNSLGLKTMTTKTILTASNVTEDVDVLFLLSVSETLKEMLLRSARLLIYTPSNEHFGIVPLEAMLAGVPVLASNTGGPLETIVDGKTGWLCPPNDIDRWSKVMYNVLHNLSLQDLQEIGTNGTERVKKEFCNTKMAERLDDTISKMVVVQRKGIREQKFFILCIGIAIVGLVGSLFLRLKTLN